MEPEFPVFKPSYPLHTRLAMLIPGVLFFGLLCTVAGSIVKYHALFWLIALALGLVTSLTPFFFIREIRFPDEMVVRRHFLPDRFFGYKELEQVNSSFVQAGGQRIRMGGIANLGELNDMIQRWTAAKILKEAQRPLQKPKPPYIQRGYGTYASFWGLIFGVIVVLMDLPWLRVDPRWVLGGTFLLVYLLYIYVIPKYL
jgi:hypothetical protein